MSSINSDEIISILKSEIENFDEISKDSEVGTVVTVGDGIATIYGIDHAMYGEESTQFVFFNLSCKVHGKCLWLCLC